MDRRNIMNHDDILLRNKTRRTEIIFSPATEWSIIEEKKYYP